MKKLMLVLLLGGVAFADQKAAKPTTVKLPPVPPSTDDLLVAELAKAAWTPADKMGYPAGAQMALIGADPTTTGTTVYLKTPGGYKMPAHWHTHNQHLVVISGKGTFTINGKPSPMVAGTYFSIPSKTPHEFVCDAGGPDCVMVQQSLGPADLNWVKPAK
jgi:quercetin dioxygenase-like cupin family protein